LFAQVAITNIFFELFSISITKNIVYYNLILGGGFFVEFREELDCLCT
jgi:hypothetical protein